jgi:hypothetical protein
LILAGFVPAGAEALPGVLFVCFRAVGFDFLVGFLLFFEVAMLEV